MREIKFRAWDKENKEMYDVELLGEKVIKLKGAEWENVEDFIIMQYTGLKDKNGKEIYEGDIVIAEDGYGNKWRGVVQYKDKHTAFFVEGKNVAAILGWHLTDNNDVFVEVIGNFYENPEFLEG